MCRKNIELYLALVLPGPRQWTALIVGLHPKKITVQLHTLYTQSPCTIYVHTIKKVEGLGLSTFN